jgi:hypothetical protein
MKDKDKSKDQSFSGYVREHLGEIEQKLGVGIRYTALHRDCVAQGFKVGLDTFRVTLYRERLKRDGVKSRKAGRAVKVKEATPRVATAAESVEPVDYFKRESVFSSSKGST